MFSSNNTCGDIFWRSGEFISHSREFRVIHSKLNCHKWGLEFVFIGPFRRKRSPRNHVLFVTDLWATQSTASTLRSSTLNGIRQQQVNSHRMAGTIQVRLPSLPSAETSLSWTLMLHRYGHWPAAPQRRRAVGGARGGGEGVGGDFKVINKVSLYTLVNFCD